MRRRQWPCNENQVSRLQGFEVSDVSKFRVRGLLVGTLKPEKFCNLFLEIFSKLETENSKLTSPERTHEHSSPHSHPAAQAH
jgi:hypothetical protein